MNKKELIKSLCETMESHHAGLCDEKNKRIAYYFKDLSDYIDGYAPSGLQEDVIQAIDSFIDVNEQILLTEKYDSNPWLECKTVFDGLAHIASFRSRSIMEVLG